MLVFEVIGVIGFYWFTTVIAWSIFDAIAKRILERKLADIEKVNNATITLEEVLKSPHWIIELVRFFVWPYGITMKAIILTMFLKRIKDEG